MAVNRQMEFAACDWHRSGDARRAMEYAACALHVWSGFQMELSDEGSHGMKTARSHRCN